MEKLIQLLLEGATTREDFEEYAKSNGESVRATYNIVSLEIAKRYDLGALSYMDADSAMNKIYPYWIEDAANFGDGFELPEPADSIYLAFDAGEWDRGDGKDPENEYTKPLIKKILENA